MSHGGPCHPPTGERRKLPGGGTFCASCGRTSEYLDDDGTWTCPGCHGVPVPIPTTWRLTAPQDR